MPRQLTVVRLNSISFTGTTWLNTVLASIPGAISLGPPDRAWGLRDRGFEGACLVHGKDCEMWRGLGEAYDQSRRFLPQLAEHAGAWLVVLNNPSPEFERAELSPSDLLVKPIQLIRDGRSIAASYNRKFPDSSYTEAVLGWLRTPYLHFPFDESTQDTLSLRYEDVRAQPRAALEKIGAYLGVEYPENATRFWEHEHHVTSGNQGLIAQLRLGQGLEISGFEGSEFYREQFESIKRDPDSRFSDDRWLSEVSMLDRFVFDLACGDRHEQFGYERDRFTLAQIRGFRATLDRAVEDGTAPEGLASLLDPSEPVPATPAPVAGVIEGPIPGMKSQLRASHIRTHGLRATPIQARKLAFAAGAAFALAAFVGFTAGLVAGGLL